MSLQILHYTSNKETKKHFIKVEAVKLVTGLET
jgi:hypothetical protein